MSRGLSPAPNTPHSSSLVAGKLGKKTGFWDMFKLFINDRDKGIEGTLVAHTKLFLLFIHFKQTNKLLLIGSRSYNYLN